MENTVNTKKLRTSKGQKNWKFNFLDAVIVLLLLLFATAAVILLLPQALDIIGGAGNVEIVYTVVFSEVDENLALTANIFDGQTVADKESGKLLGTVTGDALIDDSYQNVIVKGTNGGEILIESALLEGKKTVTVTVTAKATYREGHGYEVNGCRIACNREYSMVFPGFTGKGVCTVITVSED